MNPFNFLIITLITLILSSALGCQTPHGVYHTVQPGQTLYRISRAYGVNEKYLARINGIEDPRQLQVGEKIFVPGVSEVKRVPGTARSTTLPTPKSTFPSRKSLPAKASPQKAPSSSKSQAPQTAGKTNGTVPPIPKKGIFQWPVRGELLKNFGEKEKGPNKGIEIGSGRGSPVRSAAAGKVIYSGDGIREYGNLIILEHEDGFFTVYGYNEKNLVKTGTFVGKGEHIAATGVPPGGGSPRVYFEIRHGKEAVNPLFYLP